MHPYWEELFWESLFGWTAEHMTVVNPIALMSFSPLPFYGIPLGLMKYFAMAMGPMGTWLMTVRRCRLTVTSLTPAALKATGFINPLMVHPFQAVGHQLDPRRVESDWFHHQPLR